MVSVGLALIGNRLPDLVAQVAPQLVGQTFDQRVFWGLLLTGAALAYASRASWRCPHCRAWPGNLAARHCRSCGKPLATGPSARTYDGGFVETAHMPAPPPPERAKVLQRIRELKR
jgi:hypothetical protein